MAAWGVESKDSFIQHPFHNVAKHSVCLWLVITRGGRVYLVQLPPHKKGHFFTLSLKLWPNKCGSWRFVCLEGIQHGVRKPVNLVFACLWVHRVSVTAFFCVCEKKERSKATILMFFFMFCIDSRICIYMFIHYKPTNISCIHSL